MFFVITIILVENTTNIPTIYKLLKLDYKITRSNKN